MVGPAEKNLEWCQSVCSEMNGLARTLKTTHTIEERWSILHLHPS